MKQVSRLRGLPRRRGHGLQPKSAPGARAASLAPPAYGIEFIDRDLAGPTPFGRGPRGPVGGTGLPGRLKAGVERLSGMSMDHVKVRYGSAKPARLQALAYTQGTDIHIAPGQEKHLPHEAWHVVQQMQGRVKPTLRSKSASINDNAALEREADVMGGKAARLGPGQGPGPAGRTAEGLSAGSGGVRSGDKTGSSDVVQRFAVTYPSGYGGIDYYPAAYDTEIYIGGANVLTQTESNGAQAELWPDDYDTIGSRTNAAVRTTSQRAKQIFGGTWVAGHQLNHQGNRLNGFMR